MDTNFKNISLKQICKDQKIDPRLARMLLREAAKNQKLYPHLSSNRTVRTPWVWPEGSKGLEEALSILKSANTHILPPE